jgi:hypothetical protein
MENHKTNGTVYNLDMFTDTDNILSSDEDGISYNIGGAIRPKKHDINTNCENTIITNGKEYYAEKIWRKSKNDRSIDSKGAIFPYPTPGENKSAYTKTIISRLKLVNEFLEGKNRYISYDKRRDCLLCDAKNITSKTYRFMDIMWEDGLIHYIDKHNIEPSVQFKHFILKNNITKKISSALRTDINRSTIKKENNEKKQKMTILSKIQKDNDQYVVIDRNQLLIMDALMIHGGYEKRYKDLKENFNRYSEHAGFLDFDKDVLSKIVVSGKTTRVDEGDDEIYLPMGMDDMFDYEYIFHTHPPTPRPGGRAVDGILYEFPSIGDIYHFIDHHNEGNVIGSLVVSAEGLYNIRKHSDVIGKIDIDEDMLFKKYQRIFQKIQEDAISEYGVSFTTNAFYKKIAQDTKFIKKMNDVLNAFDINIDFYPRRKDHNGKWIIDTVFLTFRKNTGKK